MDSTNETLLRSVVGTYSVCWCLRTVVLSCSCLRPSRSILFLPLNGQLVCRRRGTTATPLLSSSLFSPCLVPHGPRPSVRRLALHSGLAAFPCCTATWWFHVLHVLGIIWHVRPSFQIRFVPWDFVSFQLWYAILHSVRTATMDQSGFFLELVDTVVLELAIQTNAVTYWMWTSQTYWGCRR